MKQKRRFRLQAIIYEQQRCPEGLHFSSHRLIIVALWNRADHYIFILFYGRPM